MATDISDNSTLTPPSDQLVIGNTPAPAASSDDDYRSGLDRPETTEPLKMDWRYVISISLVHAIAALALLPWFFSWTGVAVCFLSHYFVGTWGIGVGYHRLLTHRGFACPRWLERTLGTLGVLSLQDTPARWVAIHRMHHQHSEKQDDPHSPLVTFFWGHVGWLLFVNREHNNVNQYERYARDILKDRFFLRYERNWFWLWSYVASVFLYYGVGFAAGWLLTGELIPTIQFASSITIWGVFVRTLTVWHATWSVNSLAHMFGYRNYDINDNSRNNWFVALCSTGEGWHNNHHADPTSAQHGHRWWEFDLAWITIWIFEKVGLAWDVKRPRIHSMDRSREDA